MTASNDDPTNKTCRGLLDAFFERHPNDELRVGVGEALSSLLARDTAKRRAKGGKRDADGEKPMSLLDAAAHLLSLGTGDPMRCQDIVDLAVDRELWTPGEGKTPANTTTAAGMAGP